MIVDLVVIFIFIFIVFSLNITSDYPLYRNNYINKFILFVLIFIIKMVLCISRDISNKCIINMPSIFDHSIISSLIVISGYHILNEYFCDDFTGNVHLRNAKISSLIILIMFVYEVLRMFIRYNDQCNS